MIKESLRKDGASLAYLLQGEEPFFIDEIVRSIRKHVLGTDPNSLNFHRFQGEKASIRAAMKMASLYPTGGAGDKKMVLIEEIFDAKDWKEEAVHKSFLSYLSNPPKTTVLVCAHAGKTIDMRTSFGKSVSQLVTLFTSRKLADSKVPDWLEKFVEGLGYSIAPEAVMMMLERVGNNLTMMAKEVEKIRSFLPKGVVRIESKAIETYVGETRNFNIFELQRSVGERNTKKALKICNAFCLNPRLTPLVLISSTLHRFFLNLLTLSQIPSGNRSKIYQLTGIPPYYLDEYRKAQSLFSDKKIRANLKTMHRFDLQIRGYEFNLTRSKDKGLLESLVVNLTGSDE